MGLLSMASNVLKQDTLTFLEKGDYMQSMNYYPKRDALFQEFILYFMLAVFTTSNQLLLTLKGMNGEVELILFVQSA